jgi:restriction system protein
MPSNLIVVGVPLVLGGVAAAGWWVWHQRQKNAAASPVLHPRQHTSALSDGDFEALVVQAFQRQGYQRVDGGPHARELTLRRQRETFLVQCRHRHVAKVGVDAVQALHHEITTRGANGGFVLTAGRFSREATVFAAGCNVRLLEGAALHGLLDAARHRS